MNNLEDKASEAYKEFLNLMNSDTKFANKILKKYYYMRNDENKKSNFWKDFAEYRQKYYPFPTWITQNQVNVRYNINDGTAKKLHKDGLVRMTLEPLRYAEEDVKNVAEWLSKVVVAESVELMGAFVMEGRTRYRVVDGNQNSKMGLSKYKIGLLAGILDTFYGNIYDFVPKTLTLDEKIQWLRDEEAKKANQTKGK